MINLKRGLSIMVCMFFMLTVQVQAAPASDAFETILVEQNIESGVVTLTCRLKEGFASKRVSFLILRPGKTVADIDYSNPAALLDVVCHFDEREVDESGQVVFSFSLAANAQNGKYIVSVGGTHIEVADKMTVLDYTNVHDDQKLNQINQAITPDAMRAVIGEGFYALDLESYSKLSSAQEEKLIEKLCTKAKAGGFASIAEYVEYFNRYAAVGLLNDMRDIEGKQAVLESKSVVLGLHKDLAQKVGVTDVFAVFAEVILTKSFAEPKEIQEAYMDTLLNLCIKNSKWSELYDRLVLLRNNGADIDLSPYENIMDKESTAARVMQALAGKDVHIKTFGDALYEAVKIGSRELGSETSRPSNSGGGSGGAGLSVRVPTVKPEKDGSQAESFTDLDGVPWAKEAICYLKEQGVVSGKNEEEFDPAAPVTREEFVKMLVCSFHMEKWTADNHFTDVSEQSWYYPYINSAYQAGVIQGVSEDVFGVGDRLTREQLATIIYRAMKMTKDFKHEDFDSESPFKDDDAVSEYAKEAVRELYKKGIILGKGDGMFAPKDVTTRAETAKVLYEVIKGGQ